MTSLIGSPPIHSTVRSRAVTVAEWVDREQLVAVILAAVSSATMVP